MFIVTTLTDTIRIPAHMLCLPTLVALHSEIDLKYPNRVLMDLGLVVCRYGDCLKITNGSCVPGDGGSHHECLFRLVVFRPFVEEVCIGKIVRSSADGIQVSIGFFEDIFIPAYWMLRPSQYEEISGLWVWTPKFDDDDDDDDDEKGNDNDKKVVASSTPKVAIKSEDNGGTIDASTLNGESSKPAASSTDQATTEEEGDRFEMHIGAEIRFKVKSIQFTQVTNTAKGMQATTTTTAHSHSFPTKDGASSTKQPHLEDSKTAAAAGGASGFVKPLRKRSASVDLTEGSRIPASMHIVASICEDGLGLTSWWTGEEADEEAEGGDENEDTAPS